MFGTQRLYTSLGCAALWCAVAAFPTTANAQGFPSARPIESPPAVTASGELPTTDGSAAIAPITAHFGGADLRAYDAHVATLFPLSKAQYPSDSLATEGRVRAQRWQARLQSLAGSSVEAKQLVAFALTAARAHDTVTTKRAFDARLATTTLPPGERAYVLNTAVHTYTNLERPESAAQYLRALSELPNSGYPTQRDSTAVLYHRYDAHLVMIKTAHALAKRQLVLASGDEALALLQQFGAGSERRNAVLEFPFVPVALAMLGQPEAAGRVHAMDSIVQASMRVTDTDPIPEQYRPYVESDMMQTAVRLLQQHHLLGQAAPPISAHAWINAPDSLYQPKPRTTAVNDGTIRVLMMGGKNPPVDASLSVLERVQQRFQHGVECVFLTSTSGHAGVDVVEAPEEVVWLKEYYAGKRKINIPIALWAGPKRPSGYGGIRPTKSPASDAYSIIKLVTVVIVDGSGMIRSYTDFPLSRSDEDRIARQVEYLLAEQSATAPAEIPPGVLPKGIRIAPLVTRGAPKLPLPTGGRVILEVKD